jgi:GT2 family glycosyltransferase
MYAPIVLFAYNRPQHLKLTLESLHKNELANESDLYIYIDGPKSNATEEQLQKIEAVKQVANEKQWCKNVFIIDSASNKGLAKSIIEGVTKIVNEFGKVIVVEDDVLLSSYFFEIHERIFSYLQRS